METDNTVYFTQGDDIMGNQIALPNDAPMTPMSSSDPNVLPKLNLRKFDFKKLREEDEIVQEFRK